METTLKATLREGTGKGAARKLRATGRVPGILYGHGMEPVSVHVDGLDLLHLFHRAGGGVLIDLDVDGASHLVIPREVQRDHIRGRYVHIDFLAVRRDEKIRLSVEVREVGEAAGVKNGGVIEHHTRDVEIECFPTDVPEYLEIDVTGLEIGDMARAADIKVAEGVTILAGRDTPLISLIMPAVLQTEADLSVPGEEGVEAEEAEGEPEEGAATEAAAGAGDEPPAEPEEGGEA